jgi:hypothetical protein
MFYAPKMLVVILLYALCVRAQTPAPDASGKPVVLQKNEGEPRTRRPREGVPRRAVISY